MKSKDEDKNAVEDDDFILKAPPDGGWGWMIVLASGISNVCVMPIIQSFGLLFSREFVSIGLDSTAAAFMISISNTVTSVLGLFTAAIFKRFSYRGAALFGGLTAAIGIILTSWAKSFLHFVITFSFLLGLGFGILLPANSLAVNFYFREKKKRAIGLTMASSGIGSIIMPQVVNALTNIYDVQGTVLILGGIALNSLVGAMLLQPVRYHLKDVTPKEEEVRLPETPQDPKTPSVRSRPPFHFSISYRSTSDKLGSSDTVEASSVYGIETATPYISKRIPSITTLRGDSIILNPPSYMRSISLVDRTTITAPRDWFVKPTRLRQESICGSIAEEDCEHIEVEEIPLQPQNPPSTQTTQPHSSKVLSRLGKSVAVFFDLNLLKDPVLVNIIIGMSIMFVSEMNFTLMVPFVLLDYGFLKSEVATCMSVMAIVDTCSRFMAPFIAEKINVEIRIPTIISLTFAIVARTLLTCLNDGLYVVLPICVFIGITKGLRTVFYALILAEYVSEEDYPGAMGLNMFLNGLLFISFGPLVGRIRDLSNDYTYAMHAMSAFSFLCVILWTSEILWRRRKAKVSS